MIWKIRHEKPLANIRDICEQDSVLWLACYGKGIVKAGITGGKGRPGIRNIRTFSVNNGDEASNRFSSIYPDGPYIRFTNTGNGIFTFTGNGLSGSGFTDNRFNSINQIMHINNRIYIASSDFGVLKFVIDGRDISDIHFFNDVTTKDIIRGMRFDYWMSTNDGLILYESSSSRYFDKSYGLTVTEYQNGASFGDERSGTLFFGGINGFTSVRSNDYDEAMDYMPALYLDKLTLYGTDRDINDFERNKPAGLVLKSHENFFSVTFNALDYINGNNYTYFYKTGDGQWINNGNSGTVSFTDIPPGNYSLYVRYYNNMLNKESYTQVFPITILPPWYRSAVAYILYLLILLSGIYYIISSVSRRRRKRKEEEMARTAQRRKEEIYEARLDFFTDIAHEFCTPLTLISGPCNLILEQKGISAPVAKYAGVISRNAKRMDSLISDLMDFKQMESGYKHPEITRLNVSGIAGRVTDTFSINASGKRIHIKKQYAADITWNSDEKFLNTILVNLVSNAVKYSDGDPVKVEITTGKDYLTIRVTNKGKGIAAEDIAGIFNRFTVSDSPGKQSGWKQNGLGLTITASMVKLLSGNIHVESIPDDMTVFTVNLPALEAGTDSTAGRYDMNDHVIPEFIPPQTRYDHKDNRPTVTIIDDNPEMLWFICDILSDEFNVQPVSDSAAALETLSANHTDLILCDIMMEGMDGIELTGILKSEKSTSHIPLIIVSAAHDVDIQTEALKAGAELYLTKPFNNEYLKSAIRRLLGRKEDLKDYFASPLSAYELNMGKLQHAEHRKFLKKVYGIISKNIQNGELSPDLIASELGMSTRSLYRKLKDATDKGLLEMIHDGRLTIAENLLLKSKFTIDEIIFKSGFSNRASFYRAFSKKYGCNPKEFVEKMEK